MTVELHFPNNKVTSAVSYLNNHFNEAKGLVYESDDKGTRTINGVDYSHNKTFWVYSDNLATWALKPYEPQTSQINQTIRSSALQPSRLFEVLFGKPIPSNISTPVQLVLEQQSDGIIMVEIHNTSTPLLRDQYGDTLIYQSLNEHLRGNRSEAEYYFYKAYQMWDGKGINDLATLEDGAYANYKLALVLYASKVLGLAIPNYNRIEEKLWSMQQIDGGITSLADMNGNPQGSANAETTALALLPYNDKLISKMRFPTP